MPDELSPIEGRLRVTQESGSLSASAEVRSLDLDQEADRERLSVKDRIALADADLRKAMAKDILRVFRWANIVTLLALAGLVVLDEINIRAKLIAPSDRIISHQVIMALLAATTAQVGAIAVIIAQYLFPGR